jgi:hypothetical protein
MRFRCQCGAISDYALYDAYGVGDTLLEGVLFEIRVDAAGVFSAQVRQQDANYFNQLNANYWLPKIVADAQQRCNPVEGLTCPACNFEIHELIP